MTIKVRRGDIEFEADSEADLLVVMSVLNSGRNGTPGTPEAQETIEEKLRRVRARLKSAAQENLLEALAESESGMWDRELLERFGLHDNTALAGINAGLSKNAKAVGLEMSRIMTKTVKKDDTGRQIYHYRLTPEMRDIMKEKSAVARRAS